MLAGLFFGILSNAPIYAWIYGKPWNWAYKFPISWIGAGMGYMGTFFHEIGHTVFMWFYGYFTIPIFDFEHGGGYAVHFGGQNILILIGMWGAILYGIWKFREYRILQIMLVALFALNIGFAFTPHHKTIFNFMGPAFPCFFAAFFLIRALFNIAPRGGLERFLNAYFGFGMITYVFIDGFGLLKSQAYRLVYYQQKGAHGFGDFDKMNTALSGVSFETIVIFWLCVNTICLIIPFAFFAYKSRF